MHIALSQQRRFKAIVLLWTLVCALLSAQLAGYVHRIAHVQQFNNGWSSLALEQNSLVSVQSTADANEAVRHSCLLFDAATITDCLQHSLTLVLPQQLQNLSHLRTHAWLLFGLSPNVFNARAPPFLKI